MDPQQARTLVAMADDPGLEEATALLEAGASPLSVRARLEGSGFEAEVCRALIDCATMRRHFSHKFEEARRWLLSRTAAEQATASQIASWRAGYLRERLPGLGSVTELGTGIGGDSVFLARHFSLQGYEQDPARATLAAANISRLSPMSEASVSNECAQVGELSGDLLFADPARRTEQRQFDPESWDPPLSTLLAETSFRAVALKTAPGIALSLLPDSMEIHFLSLGGDLKEAMLLRMGLDHPESSRHAWLWPAGSKTPVHRYGAPSVPPVRPPRVGDYLHNPDSTLLRAGILGELAAELQAAVVHSRIGYLSGPLPCPDAWAASFLILETFTLAWKPLGEALMATDWSDFEYLGRGVPFLQEDVLKRLSKARKKMKGRSGGRGSLIIYRDESDYRVVLALRYRPSE